MPADLTYPGVYIEEVSSGVRTITGVATSIAAFVGYTRQGPLNTPVAAYSFADFERSHGGLDRDSPVSYAVRQFFSNGGTHALIVRVASGYRSARWELRDDASSPVVLLNAHAANPGAWANLLQLQIGPSERNPDAEFNLEVLHITSGQVERYRNLNMNPASPQFAPSVVNGTSRTIRLEPTAPPTYTRQGFAVSDEISAIAPTADRVIAGMVDGSIPFRLEIPADAALPATLGELVDTLRPLIPEPLRSRMEISASDAEGDAGTTHLRIASRTVGAGSSVTIAEGRFGGLARNIGMGRANGGREFTGDAEHQPATVTLVERGDDGVRGGSVDLTGIEGALPRVGMQSLHNVELFNLLCIPETRDLAHSAATAVAQSAVNLCQTRRAFYIADPPSDRDLSNIADWGATARSRNAALYFPAVQIADPLDQHRVRTIAASGTLAGLYARTDSNRGVWKAPAGTEALLAGVAGLSQTLGDIENGTINKKGVNALRVLPAYGALAWGARTLAGSDDTPDEYKYIPVRRLALFLEESLYRGTQWVVFEPNDEPLWALIRLNIGAFMRDLFRKGAFQGSTPRDAYFVKCDRETTTQHDINLGIVNILVGFAPLKPAEFVVIKLQQIAGDILT